MRIFTIPKRVDALKQGCSAEKLQFVVKIFLKRLRRRIGHIKFTPGRLVRGVLRDTDASNQTRSGKWQAVIGNVMKDGRDSASASGHASHECLQLHIYGAFQRRTDVHKRHISEYPHSDLNVIIVSERIYKEVVW